MRVFAKDVLLLWPDYIAGEVPLSPVISVQWWSRQSDVDDVHEIVTWTSSVGTFDTEPWGDWWNASSCADINRDIVRKTIASHRRGIDEEEDRTWSESLIAYEWKKVELMESVLHV